MYRKGISFVVAAFIFTRPLSLGDVGVDVQELQKILNADPVTQVAVTGPGSPGSETMYFGPATARAVAAFQNQYAAEVLSPLGLTSGTGIAGPLTLAKLNTLPFHNTSVEMGMLPVADPSLLMETSSTLLQDVSNISQFNLFTEADNAQVQLAFLSSNSGLPGSTFEITGTGFLPTGNKVHFGPHTISNVSSVNTNKIVMQVPDSVPSGIYDIEVSNTKGKSKSVSYFIVKASGAAPKITEVVPSVARIGDTVTIYGEHFTPKGNTIHSSLGTFENLSSPDGKKIELTLKAPAHLPEFELLFEIDESYEFKVYMSVATIYGESDKYGAPGIVTLQ